MVSLLYLNEVYNLPRSVKSLWPFGAKPTSLPVLVASVQLLLLMYMSHADIGSEDEAR